MKTKFLVRLDTVAGAITLFTIILALSVPFLSFLAVLTVRADGGDGGAWGDVFDADGNLLPGLIDGGTVTQTVSWMPTIPGYGPIPADYHVYYTDSGNSIVMPTPITLFFMGVNPSASGLSSASSSYGTGAGAIVTLLGAALGDNLNFTSPSGITYTSPDQFADALIAGEENIWSLPLGDALNMLTFLMETSLTDQDLYLLALLYTPDMCAASPAGCPLLPTPPPTEPPPPELCHAPVISVGAITTSGEKTAPEYPLVIGQDPDKRGVDVTFSASVAPTIYTYWTPVPKWKCEAGATASGAYNCTTSDGSQGHREQDGWQCIQQTESYNECVDFAAASITLSQSSRDWILNELSIRYPGAYVHHPSFSVSGSGCSWSGSSAKLQVEDPGYWNMILRGNTSGTPVSAPRNFSEVVGTFEVWLKEIAIIK